MNGVDAPRRCGRLPQGGPDLARLAEAVAHELARDGLADRAARLTAAAVAAAANVPLRIPSACRCCCSTCRSPAGARRRSSRRSRAVRDAVLRDRRRRRREQHRAPRARARRARPNVPAGAAHGSLAALQRHLFETAAPPEAPLDDGVRLTAWPGEARECVEIARAIQEEAARGVPFDRMAVLLHAPADYVAHLEEAFARADDPVLLRARHAAPASRRSRAAGAARVRGAKDCRPAASPSTCRWRRCPTRRAPADPDAAWTPPEQRPRRADPRPRRSAPVEELVADPDAAPVVAGSLRTPARWEQLLVDAAVIGGRDRWARRLDGLAGDLARRRAEVADEDEARARRLDDDLRALGHLRALRAAVDRPPRRVPAAGDLGRVARAPARARHRVAPRAARRCSPPSRSSSPWRRSAPSSWTRCSSCSAPRLRDVTEPPPRRRYGRVFVGTTRAARGMAFDVVFVPGLAENVFPGKILEDPLLLDEQRRLLGAGTLVTEAERVEGERLALRLAVGAARRRVWLSYPRVDVEKARPRVPSFYALEVLKAAEGRLPGLDALTRGAEQAAGARLGWPAPAEPRDRHRRGGVRPRAARAAPARGSGDHRGHGVVSPAGQSASRPRAARARPPLAASLDDVPTASSIRTSSRAPRSRAISSSARSFSPTALQHFAACPYRFFLQAVHRLAPREEPVAIEVLDPLTRGALFHDVQFGVLERLARRRPAARCVPTRIGEAFEVLDAVLDAEAARARGALAPAIPRVWDDEIDGLRADLREWLRRAAADDGGWVPERFELAFGLPADEREHSDPASVSDPVPVGGPLVLRGSIDLVERVATARCASPTTRREGLGQGRGGGGRRQRPPAAPLRARGERILGEAGGLPAGSTTAPRRGSTRSGSSRSIGRGGRPWPGSWRSSTTALREGFLPGDAAARGLPLLRLSSRVRALRGDPDPAEASPALRVPAGAPRHAIAPAS